MHEGQRDRLPPLRFLCQAPRPLPELALLAISLVQRVGITATVSCTCARAADPCNTMGPLGRPPATLSPFLGRRHAKFFISLRATVDFAAALRSLLLDQHHHHHYSQSLPSRIAIVQRYSALTVSIVHSFVNIPSLLPPIKTPQARHADCITAHDVLRTRQGICTLQNNAHLPHVEASFYSRSRRSHHNIDIFVSH